jgi:hypothetical protein
MAGTHDATLRLAVSSLCQYNIGEQSRSGIHFQK